VALAPITASRLQGRVRGKALTVTDPNGDVVVQAALGKAAKADYAVFETAQGKWRVERGGRSTLVALDPVGNAVATARKGEVVLPDGETLPWELSSRVRPRYRLGGDLWVAKPTRLPLREFNAELSQAMLAREDRALLAGLASILAQHMLRGRLVWAIVGGPGST